MESMNPWIEIQPGEVTQALTGLFDLAAPTAIRAFAVLAGGIRGRIFTDDLTQPAWGLVWEADDGTLYRGGRVTRELLAGVISLLRQEKLVALGFQDGDTDQALFPPEPNAGADCLEFDRPSGASDLSALVSRLPPEFALRRMDRALLERIPRLEEKLNRYGSLENLLDTGRAVCGLRGEEIACEAYADFAVRGVRELGVTTQVAYRGLGIATATCAYLLQWCEAEGNAAFWDCARLNLPSVALARRLGFGNERAYRLLAWFPGDFYGKNDN